MNSVRINLHTPISLGHLRDISGIPTYDKPSAIISCICTDSRECRTGDLFISLAASQERSIEHICEARARGAITVGRSGDIKAEDATEVLLSIAAYEKSAMPSLKSTVAITGSIGKTTTKEFLKRIVSTTRKVYATRGNRNNNIGVPLTIIEAPSDTEVLILECGMNHKGEIKRLSKCASPDIAIITNIGSAHIGNLGSREAIAEAKLEVLEGMNYDDILIIDINEPLLQVPHRHLTFSSHNRNADCTLYRYSDSAKLLKLCLPSGETSEINTYAIPEHLMPNLAAAICGAYVIGLSLSQISKGVANIGADSLRYTIVECDGFSIIDDAYNSSYESATAALEHLVLLNATVHSALLGDILELGVHARDIHYRLGKRAGELKVDKLYLVGEYTTDIRDGAISAGMREDKIYILKDKRDSDSIAKALKGKLESNELLLIKASHACGLWRIANLMKGKKND